MGLDDRRASGVGAHQDPRGDVADHEWKAKGAGSEATDQAREDDQDEIGCDAQPLT